VKTTGLESDSDPTAGIGLGSRGRCLVERSGPGRRAQQPQQTGVLPRQTQQQQPAFIMAVMQSQQAWIMSQQGLSPLVQVILTPFSVISHLQCAINMLQQQAIMPFIVMQQQQAPPASIVQRL
jgi:hypothetical protein